MSWEEKFRVGWIQEFSLLTIKVVRLLFSVVLVVLVNLLFSVVLVVLVNLLDSYQLLPRIYKYQAWLM